MNMTKTRIALDGMYQHSELAEELAEVEAAEEVAAMLRKVCETHWKTDASFLDFRAVVREAEALLAKVGG